MKLKSTHVRGATLIALLVGLSPALSAEPRSQIGNPSTADRTQQDTSTATTANDSQWDQQQRAQQQIQQQQRTPQQQQAQQDQMRHQNQQVTQQSQSYSSGTLRRQSAHELTGMDVKNRNGDSLGRVKDFVIDANSGQVVYAVVGSGGVIGIGDKLHAVPISALNYDTASGSERLTLDIASDRWEQAPRFTKDRLSSLQADQEGRTTFEYYGQTWRDAGQSLSMNNPVRNQGTTSQQQQQQQPQLVLASDIIGKNIRSGGQNVGSIEDVVLQFQNRSAALLIDPDDDFVGSDQKYVVPFNKLTLSGGDRLTTTLTREDFSSAQVAQGNSWSSGGNSGALYVWPRNESEFADRVSQRGNRMSDAGHSSRQGQPPVAEIRRAIQSDSSLTQQGGDDVRVLAQGDKVVLLGTVQSKEAKDKIEDRAEKAAPGWSIQNQIRVADVEE